MDRFKIMYRKRKKEEDRISSLPEGLLLEIITRLDYSTKEVIKTTTPISKRFQRLWTRLPILVFTNEDHRTQGNSINVVNDYLTFIDNTINQCPTDVNLTKLKIQILIGPRLQVNRWLRYAITRNVQEIDLRIRDPSSFKHSFRYSAFDDELLFNNSCVVSLKLSGCVFNPPNGVIRWGKLKSLCIDRWTLLNKDLIGKMLSGSPCLETFELTCCYFDKRIPMFLFGNFAVLESLSCDLETYGRFRYDKFIVDEDDESKTLISMKLSRCVFNPPNGAIRWDQLKFLCIDKAEFGGYSIGKILSENPCLETLQLNDYGLERIDVTSKSVKNLVLSYSGASLSADYLIEINAPYILSLKIEGNVYVEKLLLENVASLVKADLNYWVSYDFAVVLGRDRHDVEEQLLRGLLSSLCHVNEIALGDRCSLQALSRLEAKGFQFRKCSDLISRGGFLGSYRNFLINSRVMNP